MKCMMIDSIVTINVLKEVWGNIYKKKIKSQEGNFGLK